ncbi:C-C motif chemokine 28-like [Microcaecilia unicolor]|uniref:C-C motif chemokine 28-like n=1 Tax=Microcaecilia unicolor TaxID=1415580 RepID=A0A6P7X2X9_9AMPH|nr:C-C motif chemokine 28-like [Microcaecilia unicolor]
MKTLLFIACLLLLFLPSLEGMPTVNLNCCTTVAKHIPKHIFKHVRHLNFQMTDWNCNLPAAVLIFKNQMMCLDPKNKDFRIWLRRRRLTQGPKLANGQRKKIQ